MVGLWNRIAAALGGPAAGGEGRKMSILNEETVLAALRQIKDPDQGQDIVSLGMVQGVAIRKDQVVFTLEVDAARGPALEPLRKAAELAVKALPGVASVSAVLTAQRAAPPPPTLGHGGHAHAHGGGAHGGGAHGGGAGAAPAKLLANIGQVIAVASGKGGVGKSTTAVNLALALAAQGLRTGLFDADIYGPSVPRLVGLSGAKPSTNAAGRLQALDALGIKVMSIGFMVEEDTPMIWRGPMVMGALEQLLRDIDWTDAAGRDLDVLILDLPPGTGDIQLTLTQRVALAGAVIVSTPQDLALLDARKGLNMFLKVNVPVLGLIENMSYYVCPKCGNEDHIFGDGGAHAEADKLGLPFLGEVPLDIVIRETADAGRPVVAKDPDGPHAAVYKAIAAKIWAAVTTAPVQAGPKISFE